MGETLTEVLKAVVEEKGGKEVVMEKLYDLALGKGRRQSYFPALKYLIDRWEGEPVKAIAAKLEGGDIPVVLLRSKQTVQDDDGE
jgi:hypothetical protein